MRRTSWIVSVFMLLAGAARVEGFSQIQSAVAAEPKASNTADNKTGKLIVHEWGTFTSFSGSDGVSLEYRPLIDEDLPAFVLDRFLQSGQISFSKSLVRSRLRMETPVTYFYTDRERDVNVSVGFPKGLLTEFYPPVQNIEPKFRMGEKLPMQNSALDWGTVHLIPTDRFAASVDDPRLKRFLEDKLAAGLLPQADANNHYVYARETDSALVQVEREPAVSPDAPQVPRGRFIEKFLFYRGVGNFSLPLTLTSEADGTFELVNSGALPIRSLFLVDVRQDELKFARFGRIEAGGQLTLAQSGGKSTVQDLSAAVVEALVAEGLYQKEAQAMVKTWSSSWFGEMGTRLFYIVPQQLTDELLPLDINPAPDETVRVLVGRMEIMTPDDEARAIELVRQSIATRREAFEQSRRDKQRGFKYEWPRELRRLGRLAEPALARVAKVSTDPAIRYEARTLLKDNIKPVGQ